jgi:hypothetical protein
MKNKSTLLIIASWVLGILFTAIGAVNIFWGNDQEFGVFIIVLSLVYYPPFYGLFRKLTGISIPLAVKIVLALFILWSSMGVGELFEKINLMIKSFK